MSALDSNQDSIYEVLRTVGEWDSNGIQVKGKLEKLFGFWKSRFEGNNITYGPIPAANRYPRGDKPNLIVASHPRAMY